MIRSLCIFIALVIFTCPMYAQEKVAPKKKPRKICGIQKTKKGVPYVWMKLTKKQHAFLTGKFAELKKKTKKDRVYTRMTLNKRQIEGLAKLLKIKVKLSVRVSSKSVSNKTHRWLFQKRFAKRILEKKVFKEKQPDKK